jgi:hypothetical protein
MPRNIGNSPSLSGLDSGVLHFTPLSTTKQRKAHQIDLYWGQNPLKVGNISGGGEWSRFLISQQKKGTKKADLSIGRYL